MKVLGRNLKKGEVKLHLESPEDIWTLSQIIEAGDLVRGKTERKIKIGSDGDRNLKVVKKTITLIIEVEKTEYFEDKLKVLGIIKEGPDDVPRGEHHSFHLKNNSVCTIKKNEWMNFQLKRIDEAVKEKNLKILIVVFDREEAYFAELKGRGYEIIAKISGDVQKKDEKHISKDNFNKELISKIKDHEKNVEHIILASPAFWKEALAKQIPEELKKKVVNATVSQVSENAVKEVIKRPELRTVLASNRASKETKKMEEVLSNISKDLACYGLKECEEKLNQGAVSELVVNQNLLQKQKEKGLYHKIESLLKLCEQTNGTIHIISSEEAEKTLDSLSGIAGILRWKS